MPSDSVSKFIVIGKTNGIQKYLISLQLSEDKLQDTLSGVTPPPLPSFMSLAREKIFQIASITCFHPTKWIGSHTILLSSPSGSGKTTLLSDIQTSMQLERCSNLTSIFLSGTQWSSPNTKGFGDEGSKDCSVDKVTTPSSFLNSFISLVSLLVSSLSPSTDQQTSLTKWMELCQKSMPDSDEETIASPHLPPLLLIIDNIDLLLALPQVSTVESNLISRGLLKLLNLMSQSSFSCPVCLIASTSISESVIPNQFHGSPGFETIVTLPLPQAQDREAILRSLFQTLIDEFSQIFPDIQEEGIFEQIQEIDQSQCLLEANLNHWIIRSSALTSGYLPGDLVKIIRRMGTISFGRCSMHSQGSPSCTPPSITWNDFLNALNLTPPSQLLNLQAELYESGGLSGGILVEGRSSLLSWNDFAGYEKEKYFIQNILNRVSVVAKISQCSEVNQQTIWNGNEVGFPKGLLICGESGSGKSYLAKIIAAEVSLLHSLFSVDCV
jgi:SpoVK/Ycf46/Vps4 family AAA+-type ATPase